MFPFRENHILMLLNGLGILPPEGLSLLLDYVQTWRTDFGLVAEVGECAFPLMLEAVTWLLPQMSGHPYAFPLVPTGPGMGWRRQSRHKTPARLKPRVSFQLWECQLDRLKEWHDGCPHDHPWGQPLTVLPLAWICWYCQGPVCCAFILFSYFWPFFTLNTELDPKKCQYFRGKWSFLQQECDCTNGSQQKIYLAIVLTSSHIFCFWADSVAFNAFSFPIWSPTAAACPSTAIFLQWRWESTHQKGTAPPWSSNLEWPPQ